MTLWSIASCCGGAAQAPWRESHCLASTRCGGENRFDAAKNCDCGYLARSCPLCGDDHHSLISFEIRECSGGHAVHDLLKISLAAAGTAATLSTFRTLRTAICAGGLRGRAA